MRIVYKNIGETPLECLERHRTIPDIPMTYAGRLDPMAEGQLLILEGEECKEKDKYLGLDKEYEVEFLLGVETDSYDLLGIFQRESQVEEIKIEKGRFVQPYPPFSSKTFSGSKAETKEVEIYDYKKLDERTIENPLEEIKRRVALVKGDFRQEEIMRAWSDFLKDRKEFKIVKYWISCSSGTYMRSIAHRNHSLAYSIKRTSIRV